MLRALGGLLAVAVAAVSVPAAAQRSASSPPAKLDVGYEGTPMRVVHDMLRVSGAGPGDVVMDLGCGDGRIPIVAARDYGARGYCVELDPERVRQARTNALKHGVSDKVTIVEGDLFKADLSQASVITLFLWDHINLRLRKPILDLRPGTRIVSLGHGMGDWRPDRVKDYRFPNWLDSKLYFWVVPAQIAGAWRLERGEVSGELEIVQKYQVFTGSVRLSGNAYAIRNGTISGTEMSFELARGSNLPQRWKGTVLQAQIRGDGWRAERHTAANPPRRGAE